MTISKLAVIVIRNTEGLREKIAELSGVKVSTVDRWLRNASDDLTKAAVVQLVCRETGLSENQVLRLETAAA